VSPRGRSETDPRECCFRLTAQVRVRAERTSAFHAKQQPSATPRKDVRVRDAAQRDRMRRVLVAIEDEDQEDR